jgi:hypothetical protein
MYTSSLVSSWLLLSLYFRLIFLYCLGFLFQLVRAMLLWHSPNETAINSDRRKAPTLRLMYIHNLHSNSISCGEIPQGTSGFTLLTLSHPLFYFILFYFFKVVDAINWYWLLSFWTFFFWCRGHHNGPNTVSSSNITNPMMMNAPNNHHVLTPVPGDPSGRLVMTLLPSQGTHHDLMHGQHDPNIHHHSGASHTSSSHSTRYNHPGWCIFPS